jgi:uncharacterized membrane protein
MAGRSMGGGSRGGGGRSMGGGSRSGAGRSMGGGASRGSSSGSRGASSSFGGSSGSSSSSGRSMGSRSGSGRSFSSAGPNRHTSSGGNNTSRPTGSSGGFGGGFGGGPIGGGHHHHGPIFRSYGPRVPRHSYAGPRYSRGSSGCLTTFLIIFAIIFVAALFGSNNSNSYQNSNTTITSNSVKREPLEKGAVKETAYYEDNLNWINNTTKLQTGLKNFYNLTGIQPFILLVDSIGNDPTDEEIDAYANKYYDEHFEDEAHLLFIYIEDIDYSYGIVGSRGKTIMDQEAWDILYDYSQNYWHSDLEDEDMFAKVFTDAGERIMSDPNAGTKMKTSVIKVLVIAIAVIIIISILRKWQKDRALQKQKEDENLKDILNTPLETFGSKEMDDLIDKYKKDE